MEKLIARLERRFGRFAVPNLTWVIVAGMGAVYVLAMLRPGFERLLDLDFEQVKHGQVWRLFTYVFMPGGGSTIWFLLRLYFLWWVGTTLEAHWGAFRYNLYWLIGVVATTVAAILVGGFATNSFLATTLFLAFATLFPDESIFLIIFPVKAKWLGWISAAFIAYQLVTEDWSGRAQILAATANYTLFFAGTWIGWMQSRRVQNRQAARRASMVEPARPKTGGRVCAICGASEEEGADIRVCSCEKCGGVPRNLCLEHARNH